MCWLGEAKEYPRVTVYHPTGQGSRRVRNGGVIVGWATDLTDLVELTRQAG